MTNENQRRRISNFRPSRIRPFLFLVSGIVLLSFSSSAFAIAWTFNFGGTIKQGTVKQRPAYYKNSPDGDYPWCFQGRAVMRPALMRINSTAVYHKNVFPLSLGGWTLGGSVALEYDESPVGPYREFVHLGGLAIYVQSFNTSQTKGTAVDAYGGNIGSNAIAFNKQSRKRFLIGQFGTHLIVSKPEAETLCLSVWNLSAETKNIVYLPNQQQRLGVLYPQKDFERISLPIEEDLPRPNEEQDVVVQGWDRVRFGEENASITMKNLSLLWTPFIKAIWTCIPFVSPTISTSNNLSNNNGTSSRLPTVSALEGELPLHRLRISGSPRLSWNGLDGWSTKALPLGVDIILQNARIEISEAIVYD